MFAIEKFNNEAIALSSGKRINPESCLLQRETKTGQVTHTIKPMTVIRKENGITGKEAKYVDKVLRRRLKASMSAMAGALAADRNWSGGKVVTNKEGTTVALNFRFTPEEESPADRAKKAKEIEEKAKADTIAKVAKALGLGDQDLAQLLETL